MSKYDSFQTTLTEEWALAAALQALGYPVELHKDGTPLCGFQGDERPEQAHIIIRRKYLDAASNDIGFVRGTDGRFQVVLSEYDRASASTRNGLAAFTSAIRKSARWRWQGRKGMSSAAAK